MSRIVAVFFAGALLLTTSTARADDAIAEKVRKAFRGKVETRFVVAEIVKLGKPATPTVVDLLWGRGSFRNESRPYVALDVLAKLGDERALPELRSYLEGPGENEHVVILTTCWRSATTLRRGTRQ